MAAGSSGSLKLAEFDLDLAEASRSLVNEADGVPEPHGQSQALEFGNWRWSCSLASTVSVAVALLYMCVSAISNRALAPIATSASASTPVELTSSVARLRQCLSNPLPDSQYWEMMLPSNTTPPRHVIYAGDLEFADAKRIRNARVAWRVNPRAIVYAMSAQEVAHASVCAKAARLPVYGRSGGHAYEAYCEEPASCIMVDVSRMKEIVFDHGNRTGMLQAGLNLGEAYHSLYAKGYTIPGGTCHTVGLAGLTLGGGKGRLIRSKGWLIDHLFAVDLVLPDGSTLRADSSNHPELLWLARGGGGNVFPGIVTAFHFNLIDAPNVTSFVMGWNMSHAKEVIEHWQSHLVLHRDWRLDARLEVNPFDDHEVKINMVLANGSRSEALAFMKEIRDALGCPEEETVVERTWLEQVMHGSGVEHIHHLGVDGHGWDSGYDTSFKYRSLVFDDKLSASSITKLIEFANKATPESGFYLQIDPTNGAAAKLSPEATAYPWRGGRHMVMQVSTRWNGNITGYRHKHGLAAVHAYDLVEALQPEAGNCTYYNYQDRHPPRGHAPLSSYWGPNAQRVKSIAKMYMSLGFKDAWELRPAARFQVPDRTVWVIQNLFN